MNKISCTRWPDSFSGNRKPVLPSMNSGPEPVEGSHGEGSKTCPERSRRIQNPKWVRNFAIALTFVLGGVVAEAQQAKKVPRIGFLVLGSASSETARIQAFRQGLRDHGYVEGQSIAIEYRYGEGRIDCLPALAVELVRLKVDILVTRGTEAIRASRDATKTIPIVMAQSSDPVALGFVASLARPGGNITGITSISQQLVGKRLELLKEVVPQLSQVGILWNPENPFSESSLKEMEDAARALAVKPQMLEVRDGNDLDRAFSTMRQTRIRAFAVAPGGFFTTNRRRIVELASKNRLPAIYGGGEYVDAGGLMPMG